MKYNDIYTLQYLGSKSRIITNVCNPILANDKINTVVDLFAGSGSVGFALQPYKTVISNDLELYSYIINEAILNGCIMSPEEIKTFFVLVNKRLNERYTDLSDAIEAEDYYLQGDCDYREYRIFCDNTPSVFGCEAIDSRLCSIQKLVDAVTPGKIPEKNTYCLFVTYFANAYFGIRQCCEIDAICSVIADINDTRKRNILLTALMSVMSLYASTTTHFAQYLKVKSAATCKNIIEKRSKSIISGVADQLKIFEEAGLLSKQLPESKCYNLDYIDCLNRINLDDTTLVYADPPYFKEHYSRYYHVLNTLCLYDYPALDINPQTKKYSVGRYRTGRQSSDFGKRASVLGAFEKMIMTCSSHNAWMVISYSDNSIVKIDDLRSIAEKYYHVSVEKVELNHSHQGRSSSAKGVKVDEYIFICTPNKDAHLSVEERLECVRGLKPVVDNPAGFMHNYMARKPYNVISELIKQFCPDGGTVLDPMFGSGTTLIEASKMGKSAIGTDINLLAYKLCKMSLTKWNLDLLEGQIAEFCDKVYNSCIDLYSFTVDGQVRIIERCHFDRDENNLVPTKYWYKEIKGTKYTGRKQDAADDIFCKIYYELAKEETPLLKDDRLIPNSRIAIGADATVYSYFCYRNRIAMNRILQILHDCSDWYGYEVLEMLVSSAVNLIKLSDKKASSQMPYWLPKKDVTSRNAVFVIQQKAKAFLEGLRYLNDNCKIFLNNGSSEGNTPNMIVVNQPAQNLSEDVLPDGSVDLILTDPPYTDQVPYLEYSQLWYKIMGWNSFDEALLSDELVVSDAPSRGKDVDSFNDVFSQILNRVSKSLKDSGYFVMFYHTFDLKSWSCILSLMESHGLYYCHQMASAAPRKSFKTIMSPKSTLDGNYIIVFQKKRENRQPFSGTLQDAKAAAISCAHRIIGRKGKATMQDLYDGGMLGEAFEQGYLSLLADSYSSFAEIISGNFEFDSGYWREKQCTGS